MRAFAESSAESCTAMVCSCRLIYLRSGSWIKSSGVEWPQPLHTLLVSHIGMQISMSSAKGHMPPLQYAFFASSWATHSEA